MSTAHWVSEEEIPRTRSWRFERLFTSYLPVDCSGFANIWFFLAPGSHLPSCYGYSHTPSPLVIVVPAKPKPKGQFLALGLKTAFRPIIPAVFLRRLSTVEMPVGIRTRYIPVHTILLDYGGSFPNLRTPGIQEPLSGGPRRLHSVHQ